MLRGEAELGGVGTRSVLGLPLVKHNCILFCAYLLKNRCATSSRDSVLYFLACTYKLDSKIQFSKHILFVNGTTFRLMIKSVTVKIINYFIENTLVYRKS